LFLCLDQILLKYEDEITDRRKRILIRRSFHITKYVHLSWSRCKLFKVVADADYPL